MKKVMLFLTILMVGMSFTSNAQIKKVEPEKVLSVVKRGPIKIAFISQSDSTHYSLSYNDASFTEITVFNDIKFEGNSESLNQLYEMFSKQIVEKDTETNFVLGNKRLQLTKQGMYLRVSVSEPLHIGQFVLTKNEIDKLFSKK